MAKGTPKPPPPVSRPGRRRAGAALAIVLVIFAAVVAVVSLQLREQWRAQVLQREGDVLHAVAAMQRAVVAESADTFEGLVVDPALEVALQTSKLRGVLAVRVYATDGGFLDAVPLEVDEGALPAADLGRLLAARPVVRFHPEMALDEVFLQAPPAARAPLLEVNAPLAAVDDPAAVEAVVQYWINGLDLAAEFARLDRRVALQAGVAFGAGAFLIAGLLLWAFRRLDEANLQLASRAEDLSRANRELAQAARTSAIGAITAHLMHGIRNPLAGLAGYVEAQAGEGAGSGEEWAAARESTRRLRAMVDEVHAVLRDVEDGADFVVTTEEIFAGLRERLDAPARARGIEVEYHGDGATPLEARCAGIGSLVLANLIGNALDASPRCGRVLVSAAPAGASVAFFVADRGPGLPEAVRQRPFQPCRSTKPDGAGIGLAISHQLAGHAGGALSVLCTGADGTTMRLELPLSTRRPLDKPL